LPCHGRSPVGLPDHGRSLRGGPPAGVSRHGRSLLGAPAGLPDHGLSPLGAPVGLADHGRSPAGFPDQGRSPRGGPAFLSHGRSLFGLPDHGRSPAGFPDQGRSPRGGPPGLLSHGFDCPERGGPEGGRVEGSRHGRSPRGARSRGWSLRGGALGGTSGFACAGGRSLSSRRRSLCGRCFFLCLSNRARGSLCSPPGRHSRSRGGPALLMSRAFRPAHCDCSCESHSLPRANHFISITGLVRRNCASVGSSSSCFAARNAVGLPSIRMVQ
jgi:hypothetical protein